MIDISRRTLAGLAVVYVASQVLPVTRLAYWPSEVWIDGAEVTMERHYPGDWLGLPRPQISYVETVTPISGIGHNGGHNCQDARGAKRYARPEVISWNISSWAASCIDDPKGYRWQATWKWHLGGFTFGSTSMRETVINNSGSGETMRSPGDEGAS